MPRCCPASCIVVRKRQLSDLSRLIAQGLSESDSISVEDLVDALRQMLPELIAGQKEAVSTGRTPATQVIDNCFWNSQCVATPHSRGTLDHSIATA